MSQLRFWSTVICCVCLGAATGAAAPPPAAQSRTEQPLDALPVPPQEVVDHVSRSVAWYRRIVALQQLPVDADDVLPRERAYHTALTSLRVAFEFGQAAAELAGKKPRVAAESERHTSAEPTGKSGSGAGSSSEHASSSAEESGSSDEPAGSSGEHRGSSGATAGNSASDAGGSSKSASRSASGAGGSGSSASSSHSSPANSQEAPSSADQAAARIADHIADLQSQLIALDQQIAHAHAKEKATLSAKRGEVSAALDLAKEIQGSIGQIQRFEETMESHGAGSSGGLAAQIADLRRSVPELRTSLSVRGSASTAAPGSGAPPGGGGEPAAAGGGPPAGSPNSGSASSTTASPGAGSSGAGSSAGAPSGAAPATAAANADTFRPESAGVIALLGKWFSLEGSRRQLADAMKQTDGLQKNLENIRHEITQEARELARQSLDVTSSDASQLLQSKQKFEQAAARFKQLSTLLIPLGEQGVTLDTEHSILQEWRDSLSARTATIARYLALRLLVLFGSIAVVLVVSEVWRRATFRYLHDTRRRQQFLALRRVAVGLALTFVIVFGLVSEVGSLATYAGLITAGLAVALQNVILAVVAYFFLIGRYGVRIGDRITLAGVTGRVVEIGLVRIYLMELAGPQMRSTGRMVVLSNAVLFQPTAMFKQMPGADFHWHTITLTLAPTTDVEAAEKRLREAAESVYEKYRPAIEQRHAELQRFIDFQTAMPAPEVYARLSAKGLECTVRYPLEPSQAVVTDQRMLVAIRQAQAKEPPLEVVEGPVLDTSES